MVEQFADEAARNLGRSATGCVFEAGHNTRRGRCRSAMEAPIQRLVGTMERTSRIERRPHYRDLDGGLRERGPPRYAGVGFSVTARPKAKSAQDGAGNGPRHRHPPRRVIDNGNRFKTGPGQHRLPRLQGHPPPRPFAGRAALRRRTGLSVSFAQAPYVALRAEQLRDDARNCVPV